MLFPLDNLPLVKNIWLIITLRMKNCKQTFWRKSIVELPSVTTVLSIINYMEFSWCQPLIWIDNWYVTSLSFLRNHCVSETGKTQVLTCVLLVSDTHITKDITKMLKQKHSQTLSQEPFSTFFMLGMARRRKAAPFPI